VVVVDDVEDVDEDVEDVVDVVVVCGTVVEDAGGIVVDVEEAGETVVDAGCIVVDDVEVEVVEDVEVLVLDDVDVEVDDVEVEEVVVYVRVDVVEVDVDVEVLVEEVEVDEVVVVEDVVDTSFMLFSSPGVPPSPKLSPQLSAESPPARLFFSSVLLLPLAPQLELYVKFATTSPLNEVFKTRDSPLFERLPQLLSNTVPENPGWSARN